MKPSEQEISRRKRLRFMLMLDYAAKAMGNRKRAVISLTRLRRSGRPISPELMLRECYAVKRRGRREQIYAIYIGDTFVNVGTAAELARDTGMRPQSIVCSCTPKRKKRSAKTPYEKRKIVIKIF